MNRLTALLLAVSFTALAHDDDDDDDDRHERDERHLVRGSSQSRLRADPRWATYERECGACHLAFSPTLLPASSWKALLGKLDDHFGQNAELDAATRKTLETWLSENAKPGVGAAPLRITETSWWTREHHELAPSVYRRASIGTKANCAACHPRANEGAFGEHEVRIPRDAPAPR